MKKIGLITYHSAYNFGSVLQAYATQEIVKSLTGDCEIINYRMKEQKRVYAIYNWDNGWKSFIKNVLTIPQAHAKKARAESYERFFKDRLNLSPELDTPSEVKSFWSKYDLIISGSDQIWNKHSNELERSNWDVMDPYLLKGYEGTKVSYASSITSLTDEELGIIAPSLKDFKYLSSRESYSAARIEKIMGRHVAWVVDPTFLFRSYDWIKHFNLKNSKEEYILYYSLSSFKNILEDRKYIKTFASGKKLKVKFVAPLSFINESDDIFESISDVGPIEFLNLIYNAKIVVTDSYHGTILSVNFGKDVYSICPPEDSHKRKIDILRSLGMEDRILHESRELVTSKFQEIDYKAVNERIDKRRQKSMEYLRMALNCTTR